MFDSTQRRNLYLSLVREERAKLIPNCGRLSGQQVAYAKGRATIRFAELERLVTQREP